MTDTAFNEHDRGNDGEGGAVGGGGRGYALEKGAGLVNPNFTTSVTRSDDFFEVIVDKFSKTSCLNIC